MSNQTAPTLWLIDDDPALRLILEDNFSNAGLNVISFSQAHGAWMRLNDVKNGKESADILPDAILTDIRMPMMDGLSFSDWVHKAFPQLPIIIMTAHSDLQSAVDSYQTGAFEYLPKPFDLDEAVIVVQKAVNKNRKTEANQPSSSESATPSANNEATADSTSATSKTTNDDEELTIPTTPTIKNTNNTGNRQTKKADTNRNPSGIIGQSTAMQNVFRAIGRLAHSPITVLITGESGTGKELVAHALHETSPRKEKPLIALNMAAIPHDLIESELFGHEKGAFTGATATRQGRFEQANGGTLFLDEIGDMPFSTQTRLLRVLANGEFFRVGGQKPIKVDVRIIAATHQNLEDLVKQGKFREDLFYRLNVIRLPLPALRERKEDIPLLVEHFLQKSANELNSPTKKIDEKAMEIMATFDWHGNVRQLENACRWLTVMTSGDTVYSDDLPPEILTFAQTQQTQDHAMSASSVGTDLPTELANLPANQLPQNHTFTNNQMAESAMGAYPSNVSNVSNVNVPHNINSQHSNPANHTNHTNHTDQTYGLNWTDLLYQWSNQALKNGETELLATALPNFERIMIDTTLTHTKGHKGKAADLLGWGRNTLTRKIQQLGLDEKW